MTGVFILLGVVVALLLLFFLSYKKVPKNRIGIRVGPFGNKTVTGKAIFVIPFLQRIDYMTLENIQVDFESKSSIPTKDAINIKVDAVANIAISQDPEVMKRAASRFTGYGTSAIASVVTPVLEGNIREIISQTYLKDLIQGDKKEFSERVVENVSPNLKDMGLRLTTFNIQNFKDNNGVIKNLGIENTEQIKKDASIAAARAQATADSLAAVEQWMKAQEEAAEQVLNMLLADTHFETFIFNFLVIAVSAAIGEEFCFRGVLQGLMQHTTKAIWLTAIIFSVIHFQFDGFFPRMLMGALFGYMLVWTDNLWIPIIMHCTNNAAITILSYIATLRNMDTQVMDAFGTEDTLWVGILSLVIVGIGIYCLRRSLTMSNASSRTSKGN